MQLGKYFNNSGSGHCSMLGIFIIGVVTINALSILQSLLVALLGLRSSLASMTKGSLDPQL